LFIKLEINSFFIQFYEKNIQIIYFQRSIKKIDKKLFRYNLKMIAFLMSKSEIKFEEKGIQVLNENFENKCLLNEKSFIYNKSFRKRTQNKRKIDTKLRFSHNMY
jgi:hypothetical protein